MAGWKPPAQTSPAIEDRKVSGVGLNDGVEPRGLTLPQKLIYSVLLPSFNQGTSCEKRRHRLRFVCQSAVVNLGVLSFVWVKRQMKPDPYSTFREDLDIIQ